jgi:hypothetical protein
MQEQAGVTRKLPRSGLVQPPLINITCPCVVPIIRLPGTALHNLRLDSVRK